jgi:hypothetical protein
VVAGRRANKAGGARLLCLRKYSPGLNPIEQVFAKVKGRERTPRAPSARSPTQSPMPSPAPTIRKRGRLRFRLNTERSSRAPTLGPGRVVLLIVGPQATRLTTTTLGEVRYSAIIVAVPVAQDVEMEMLGMGRVRARSQHGGEPVARGLPHCAREQRLRGIRFMADSDMPPIGERDCREIDGEALGMRVRIAAREPDRAAARVAAGSERDNARAEDRRGKGSHQMLRKLGESKGERAIENRMTEHVDRSAVRQANRAHANRRVAERIWRCENDDGLARPPHLPL